MQMECGSAFSHGAGKRADSGLGAGRYRQCDGMGHDLDADRQMAQNLSVGFNEDARQGAVAGTALDRDDLEHFNLARRPGTAQEGGDLEVKAAQEATRFEGYQSQALIVQGGAGDEVVQGAAEVANADGQKLGDFLDARLTVRPFDKGHFKEGEGVRGSGRSRGRPGHRCASRLRKDHGAKTYIVLWIE